MVIEDAIKNEVASIADAIRANAPKTLEDFLELRNKPMEELLALGCNIFDEDKKGTHWTFPFEWLELIPEGLEVVDIYDNVSHFKREDFEAEEYTMFLPFGFIKSPENKL